MTKPYIFYVNGISCNGCSKTIESSLTSLTSINISDFSADITTPDPKQITINATDDGREHKTVWLEIQKQIENSNTFRCEAYDYPLMDKNLTLPTKIKNVLTSHWFLGSLGCTAGIALMSISLVMGVLPLMTMIPIASLSIVLTLALGAHSYHASWTKWVADRALTMDTLFAISTLTVLVVSVASFFVPWLPMMFDASLLIYGFKHIGIAIQDTIKEKISSAKFQDRAPKFVRILSEGTIESRQLSQIKQDDTIIVNPGEIIPLDGVCQEEGSLYNLLITGDPIPRRFQLNEPVLAGMQVSGHANSIKIRVSKTTQNSYLARLDEGIAKSISEKAPIELKTNRYLAYFIPTVIGLSIISGILIGLFFTPALAIQCAISVLVSACPCTLGLITPLAVKTGMNKATEHGVQFKNATVLEQAEQIDVVVFDLNGTLTTGIPEIKSTMILNDTGLSLEALKNICSALEKDATHPIGKAIYSFSEKNCTKQLEITGIVDQSHHAGRSAQINDEQYTIGSKSLMHYKNISTEELEHQLNLSAGDSVVFIARNDTLVGYFIITDPLRPDAAATIKALTQMGKKIHLCTGADEATALRYANILGIREVHANYVATHSELNDKSKPAYINSLKLSKLKVAMVGDAANDAPAMSNCDFGIAVVSHNSDAITQKTAGAIIHKGTLLPIASAFAISQQTVSNIKQNLIMSLSYNLMAVLASGGLLVAIGISLNPGVCVALMAIQACIILLNVYRFKYQALTHLQEEPGLSQKTVIDDLSSYSQIDKSAPKQTHQNQTHNVPTETQPIQTGNIPRTSFFKSGIPTQDNEYPKPLIRLF